MSRMVDAVARRLALRNVRAGSRAEKSADTRLVELEREVAELKSGLTEAQSEIALLKGAREP